jgi:hypothetical protein
LLDAYGWFFQHDPRWGWLEDVLGSFGALSEEEARPYRPGYMEGMLEAAGFEAVAGTEDACPLLFRDEDEWWRWMWSHGSRTLLEAVQPARLEELKEALFRGMGPCTAVDGSIHGTLRAAAIGGRKPPSA